MILRLCCLVSTDDIRKVLSDEYFVPLRGTRLNDSGDLFFQKFRTSPA